MKIFETITDYLKIAKKNDVLIFGGTGIMDGLKNKCKTNTFKLVCPDTFHLKAYGGKKLLTISEYYFKQQIGVIDATEFKQLPKY